jgi:hypothetical protein
MAYSILSSKDSLKIAIYAPDGRNHSVTPWCIQDFIFHYVFFKKKRKKTGIFAIMN